MQVYFQFRNIRVKNDIFSWNFRKNHYNNRYKQKEGTVNSANENIKVYMCPNYANTRKAHKLKTKKVIDKNYKYLTNNVFKKFTSFIYYRVLATPFAFIYSKMIKHIKFENKKVLKECKDRGYFVYANRTADLGNFLAPHLALLPKRTYTVAHTDNVCNAMLGNLGNSLGVLPVPNLLNGNRNFMNAIEKRVLQGNAVLIYPEEDYKKGDTIKPYSSTAFRYPVKFVEASYCFTTTYQQGKSKKKPKIVVYVDGPFYINKSLDEKSQQEDLRDRIYKTMCERLKNNNYQGIKGE